MRNRLELGSGWQPVPGFTHLDINASMPDVDIIGSFYPLPAKVRETEWDELRAVDCLEHASYRDTNAILRDWCSVLKIGGRIFIQVPDAGQIMRWYAVQDDRLLAGIPEGLPQTHLMGATWRLFGGHLDGERAKNSDDFRWNAHYAAFTPVSLKTHLRETGFDIAEIKVNPFPNIQCWAVKR